MREILFRAKRIDNGEWVSGYYVYDYAHNAHFIFKNQFVCPNCINDRRIDYSVCDYEIDPDTLCQYTGLKDKNGNRIWENDILQNARNNDLYTVKWHGSFGMYAWSKRKENNKHIFDYGDLYLMNRKCVVIGNIFDDPELLKGE